MFEFYAYMMVPRLKRYVQVNDKSTECIFIGYANGLKLYILYDLGTWKIHDSRDLFFNEEVIKPLEN